MVDRRVPLEVDIKDISSRLINIESLLVTLVMHCMSPDEEEAKPIKPKVPKKSLVDNSITARMFVS